jgi:hypothetical protein
MSLLQYLIGTGLILLGMGGLGIEVEDALNGQSETPCLGFTMVAVCLSLGAFALLAASSRYNGGWLSAIGLCLMALGLLLVGAEADEYRAGRRDHTISVVVFAMGFLGAGAIVFHAGHQKHVCAQRHRQSRDDAWLPQADEIVPEGRHRPWNPTA